MWAARRPSDDAFSPSPVWLGFLVGENRFTLPSHRHNVSRGSLSRSFIANRLATGYTRCGRRTMERLSHGGSVPDDVAWLRRKCQVECGGFLTRYCEIGRSKNVCNLTPIGCRCHSRTEGRDRDQQASSSLGTPRLAEIVVSRGGTPVPAVVGRWIDHALPDAD